MRTENIPMAAAAMLLGVFILGLMDATAKYMGTELGIALAQIVFARFAFQSVVLTGPALWSARRDLRALVPSAAELRGHFLRGFLIFISTMLFFGAIQKNPDTGRAGGVFHRAADCVFAGAETFGGGDFVALGSGGGFGFCGGFDCAVAGFGERRGVSLDDCVRADCGVHFRGIHGFGAVCVVSHASLGDGVADGFDGGFICVARGAVILDGSGRKSFLGDVRAGNFRGERPLLRDSGDGMGARLGGGAFAVRGNLRGGCD